MEFTVEPNGDRLDVATADGRRFTFPLAELQATRRRPRPRGSAKDLPISTPLQLLEAARRAAEEFAALNGLI